MRETHTVAILAPRMKKPMGQTLTTPSQVGAILRARRKARGLSQQDLAGKLGVSQSRLSILEQRPEGLTLDRLLLLAKLLGLEIVVQDRAERPAPRAEW